MRRKRRITMIESAYAVCELERWFRAHQGLLEEKGVVAYMTSCTGSASVRIEMEKYLIDLSTWDHASCLDIQILEIETETSTFPHLGECENKSEFRNHLERFTDWFSDEASNDNT